MLGGLENSVLEADSVSYLREASTSGSAELLFFILLLETLLLLLCESLGKIIASGGFTSVTIET